MWDTGLEGIAEKLKDYFCAQMFKFQERTGTWIVFQIQGILRTTFLKVVVMKLPFHTATVDFPQVPEEPQEMVVLYIFPLFCWNIQNCFRLNVLCVWNCNLLCICYSVETNFLQHWLRSRYNSNNNAVKRNSLYLLKLLVEAGFWSDRLTFFVSKPNKKLIKYKQWVLNSRVAITKCCGLNVSRFNKLWD